LLKNRAKNYKKGGIKKRTEERKKEGKSISAANWTFM